MLRGLFARKPDPQAETFAEAQALIDDGLDLEFVLGLFPEDAPWLRAELSFAKDVEETIAFEPPSYYFEASLKSRFIAAGRAVAQPVSPAPRAPFRTAVASMGVLAGAGIVGVLALGFVTAGGSVPGDWNYTFKIANERLQYALASGNDRVDIQLKTAEQRVYELQKLTQSGDVNASDVASLRREMQSLADLAAQQPLDAVQKERAIGIAGTATAVLDNTRTVKPALDPSVSAAAAAVGNVTSVVTSVNPLPPPVATATASPTATADPTATTSPTATSSASASPAPGRTPSPTPSPSPSPSPTHTPAPLPTATPTPSATLSPSATASATAPLGVASPSPASTATPNP